MSDPERAPSRNESRFRGGRRLLRRLLPLLALGALATWFFSTAPEQTTISYDLQGRRDGLRSLEVDLVRLPSGELVRRAQFSYSPSSPPPPEQVHPARLTRGEYEARLELVYQSGRREASVAPFRFEGQEWISLPVKGP